MLKTTHKILLVIIVTGMTGCATSPVLDQNWGRSYETAKQNQILNPDAGKNMDPVEGLAGPAAERAIKELYHPSEKKQEPSMVIGIETIEK